MFKKTLLATTVVTFAATTAFAEGAKPTPKMAPKQVEAQMTAEQIETYSTQTGTESAILLTFVIGAFLVCAVACGSRGSAPMPMPSSYR